MPEISVIVPVYKVEPYLRRCVDSILNQTFSDFELILVDDGSPDNCPAICDEYAAKDARIKVIHKENGGVSSARNAGLDAAVGKYVTFIDSDDWVGPNYLLELCVGNEDLICQTADFFDEDGFFISHVIREPWATDELSRDLISQHTEKGTFNWTHCKRFKTGLICENGICFDEQINFGEDTLFTVTYAGFAKTMRVENVANYYYVQYSSRETLSNRYSQKSVYMLQKANQKIAETIYPKESDKQLALYVARMSGCYNCRMAVDMEKIGQANLYKRAKLLFSYAEEKDFYFVLTMNGRLYLSDRIKCALLKRKFPILLLNCFLDVIEKGCRKIMRLFIK